MNLIQKLVEVRKVTGGVIQKDSHNKFDNFDYASSGAILSRIRDAMNEQGILIVPSILDSEKEGSGNKWAITINMMFKIINAEKPEDFIEIPWCQNATGACDKAIGSALTYAEKYLILKLFNIETSADDPDSQKTQEYEKPKHVYKPKVEPVKRVKVSAFQYAEFQQIAVDKMVEFFKTGDKIKAYLNGMGFPPSIELSEEECSGIVDDINSKMSK